MNRLAWHGGSKRRSWWDSEDVDRENSSDSRSAASSISSRVSSVSSPMSDRGIGKMTEHKSLPLSKSSLMQLQKQMKSGGDADEAPAVYGSSARSSSAASTNASSRAGKKPGELVNLDDLPSTGSTLHAQGACSPCLFVNSQIGCSKGKECSYCHLAHAKPKVARRKPSQAKKERVRTQLLARQVSEGESGCTASEVSPDFHSAPSPGLEMTQCSI